MGSFDEDEKVERLASPLFIMVLSGSGEEKEAIAQALAACGAEFDFASTASGIRDVINEKPCNGLLFCIASLVCLDMAEKELTQLMESLYRVARIRWNKKSNSFSIMASCPGIVETLPDFLSICSGFTAKRMRRHERVRRTLNVLISTSSDLSDAERTFTTDLACDGCYVHSNRSWNVGDTAFIHFQELSSKTAIEVCIVRCVPWGTPFQADGIGLDFINIDPALLRELEWLLYGK